MVRYTEGNELDETKPHSIPDFENDTQSGKPVTDPAPLDSQDTARSPKVSIVRKLAARDGRHAKPGISDTKPTVESVSEEQLAVLSKVLSERPDNPEARRSLYLTLYRYLRRHPFLRYLEENDVLYRVITGEGRVITVPKDREVAVKYPPKPVTTLQRSYRWLGYSLFGLLLAGLGAVICAPVAASFAWRAAREASDTDQRNRAGVALVYAFGLWGIGLLFGFLFVLHL